MAAIAQRHTLLRAIGIIVALLDQLVYIYGKVNQYCESLELSTITVFGLGTDLIVTPNYKSYKRNSVTQHRVAPDIGEFIIPGEPFTKTKHNPTHRVTLAAELSCLAYL